MDEEKRKKLEAAGWTVGPPSQLLGVAIKSDPIDNLIIGEDDHGDGQGPLAVLLYTPNMADTKIHHHIELNVSEGEKLQDWLTDWLLKVKK